MVFGDFVEALFEDKIAGVADFIIGDGDNSSAPGTVRETLFISGDFVNNCVCLCGGFNGEPADIDIGKFVMPRERDIPVV